MNGAGCGSVRGRRGGGDGDGGVGENGGEDRNVVEEIFLVD